MSASVIVVLVGIPGAGKTTFSNAFKTYFDEYQVTIFHYDELCKTFSADERKYVLELVETHVNSHKDTKHKHIVIIDDNNYYKSMRYEYLQLCRKHNLGFVVVYLNVSLEKALEQNSRRNQTNGLVPVEVVKKMYETLEVPLENENVIHVFNEGFVFNSGIQRKIEYAFANPQFCCAEPIVNQSMTPTVLQQIDLVLRKIVNRKIQENTSKAQEYNRIKKNLYKDIKNGNISSSLTEHDLSKYFD